MEKTTFSLPPTKAGTRMDQNRQILLYTLIGKEVLDTLPEAASISISGAGYLPSEADRFLLQARRYRIRTDIRRSYDVYSTDNSGSDKENRDAVYQEIAYENLVICEGKLCGVFYTEGEIAVFFPWESPQTPIGEPRSLSRRVMSGYPLDYIMYTEKTVSLVPNEG